MPVVALLDSLSSPQMNPQRPAMELFDPAIVGNSPVLEISSSPSPLENSTTLVVGLIDLRRLPTKAPHTGATEAQDVYFTLVVLTLSLAVMTFVLYFLSKFVRYIRRLIQAASSPEDSTPNADESESSPPPKNRNNDDAPPQYDGPPPYEVAIRMSAIEDSSVGSLSKYVSSSIIV